MDRTEHKKEVEAVLLRRAGASSKPDPDDLRIPYEYIKSTFRGERNEGTSASASAAPHWYCSRCPVGLHREVATYLVFLFAFGKGESAQQWLAELESVLECESCARGFGTAKRRFKRKYLGGFPEAIHLNFFAAVDKWLVEYIQTRSSGKDGLDSLPVALLHLVLAEPRFIDHPGIRPIIDRTRDKGKLAVLGLSPLLIRLAARDATWSMEACKLKPASTRTWSDEGVGAEVQALYTGQPNEREWSVITAILRTGALSAETLQQGLLDGRLDTGGGKPAKGLMSVLGSRLSGSSPALLEQPKTRSMALACLKPYLQSTLGSADAERSAFGETLAKMANYAFSEMQHNRLSAQVRAEVAKAGLEAISAVEAIIHRSSPRFIDLSATMDIHAASIANVAFRISDYPEAEWCDTRQAARDLISACLEADNKDAAETTFTLALFATKERMRVAKKAKGVAVAAANKPAKMPKASIRKALWGATYNAVSPRDPGAIALLMDAISRYAHLDLLDAERAWGTKDLHALVDPTVWLDSVNTVNVNLKTSREHFAQTIESFSLQPQGGLLRSLFALPQVAHSAMLLLLSPDDSINEAILSLIQQAFDADDRSEAFRMLLRKHPMDSVQALAVALQNFTTFANSTPESCSLAKRLVRCFYDIVEALCSSTDGDEPLLSSETFMDAHRGGTNMRREIKTLWHLMTTTLAVIYKRTVSWAGWFDNAVMTEWMRDALILGSQLCDKVRMFESAVLGVTGPTSGESPARVSNSGMTLVARLHIVLRDLTLWLRLTDVEILYQTYNLIKVILQRTAKANFDVSKSFELKESVSVLQKFVTRPSKSYTSKLSEDKISELSELIAPFSPSIEDEVEFLSITPARSSPASSPPRETETRDKKNPFEAMMEKARRKGKYAVGERKDAFAEMMKSSQGTASKYKTPTPKPKEEPKPKSTSVDDFDDDFLDNLSSRDLDIIEKRAKISSTSGAGVAKPVARPMASLNTARSAVPTPKLNVNVVPKPTLKKGGVTTSRAQMRAEMRSVFGDRPKIGGVIPSIPAASSVGSGLGAYQPPKPVVAQRPDSDTSDSSDSDDDRGGMSQLISKVKKPIQLAYVEPIRPKLKYTDDAVHLEMRRRQLEKERHMRRQKRLKPDLGPLFRFVLSWDPASTDPQPPHPERVKMQLGQAQPIPVSFGNAEQYDRVMLPLFLQELWAQSLNDKQMEQDIAAEVTSRAYEDDWIDVELAVVGSWPERTFLNESDVVILSQPGNPKKVFARIQGVKKTFKQANIKVRIAGAMDAPTLVSKNKWLVRKHLSLSTALREFGALRGLPFYEPEMLRDILGGKSAHLPIMNESEVRRTMSTYDVNEPQAKAIIGSTRIDGFALIQGPPGTGKTKTISGLVGKWLSDRPNPLSMPNNNTAKKQKLLVCAPSNAAIDEVCKRLMVGVPTAGGERKVPFIVRIGIDNSVNDAVKDRSLDNLVEARVSNVGGKGDSSEYGRIQAELEDVKGKIHAVQQQLSTVQQNDEKRKELEAESHWLNTKRVQLGKQSSKAKDAARDANRHLDGARRAAKTAVLEEADIVCATLSGAGQEILAAHEFETVIIDEAAQAIELACLIPLKYGCKRCIMVGDPNQLPPTTFSTAATKLRYNESLFVRMANLQPQNMHLLSIQYRMHPDISELPSRLFYKSKLSDGPEMASKTAALWHSRNVFGPYRFFDVRGQEERQSTSTKNRKEAQVAVQLYKALGQDFGDKINLNMRVGIISMYREQIYEMRRSFMAEFGQEILSAVEFNTVDGFQGQEKDIIILSTVRSGPGLTSIGFLRDFRRMNVALTRAKSSLFVIGNADTLARCDDMWNTIVGDARDRGFLIQHNDSTFKSLAPPPKPAKVEPKPKPVERVPVKRKTSPPRDLQPVIKKVKEEPKEVSLKSVKRERSSSASSSSSSSESEMGLDELAGKKQEAKKTSGANIAPNGQGLNGHIANGKATAPASPKPAGQQVGVPSGPPRFEPGARPPPMRPPGNVPMVPRPPPPPIVHRPPTVVAAETAFRTKKKKPINGAVRPQSNIARPPNGVGPSFGPR